MANVYLSIFKKIIEFIIDNGLADPRYPAIVSNKFHQFYDRDDGLIDSIGLASVDFDDTDLTTRSAFKSPGKYTGEMRKVVQALYSQGLLCLYGYKSELCHGIYTAADDSKWVIEISSGGILAAPLPVDSTTHSEHVWLGYTPIYDADLFDPSNPDLITLATDTIVADYYSKSEVFTACGWAFDSTGHNAQNCCTSGGTEGSGTPSTGYRYKIAISETSNMPSSALMSLVESGDFALPRFYGMKVPSSDETQFDQTSNQEGQTGIGVFSAPRYVFYDGDVEKVVRSKGSESVTTNPSGSVPWSYETGCRSTTDYAVCVPENIDQYGGPWYVAEAAGATLTSSSYGTVVDGYTLGENVSGANVAEWVVSLTPGVYQFGRTSLGKAAFNVYLARGERYYLNSTYKQHVSYCLIPIGDRESVYQYQWDKKENTKYAIMEEHYMSQGTANGAVWTDGCTEIELVTSTSNRLTSGASLVSLVVDAIMPVVGEIWCRFPTTDVTRTFSYGPSGHGSDDYSLSIVSTGSLDDKMWTETGAGAVETSYNKDPIPEFPQYMRVHSDSTKNPALFCSKIMNGNTGADYYVVGIDQVKYPVSSLLSGDERFFVGEP